MPTKAANEMPSLYYTRRANLCTILHAIHARLSRAIGAAVESIIGLNAVTDDLAPAVVTDRGEFVNRALEAIERVSCLGRNNFKRQVIIVTAHFTLCHRNFSLQTLAAAALACGAQMALKVFTTSA